MRLFRDVNAWLCIAVIVMCLTGCATLQATFNIKPWTQRTPTEKVLAMYDTYNATYRNTMSQATKPVLTEEEKKVVRTKKEVLRTVRPLISAYDGIVLAGGTPSQKSEDEILKLFDRIGASIAGR